MFTSRTIIVQFMIRNTIPAPAPSLSHTYQDSPFADAN